MYNRRYTILACAGLVIEALVLFAITMALLA